MIRKGFECKVFYLDGTNMCLTLSPIKISRFLLSFPRTVFFFLITFWPHWAVYGILVPQSGIEPVSLTAEEWSLNCGTAREVCPEQSFKCDYVSSRLCSIFCLCLGIRHQTSTDMQWNIKYRFL